MSDPTGSLAGLTPEQKRAMLARILRERARKPRRLPASYAQRTLWALEQMAPGRPTYNMHAALRVEGPLDTKVLARAINEIVRRHESLRTTFADVDGEPMLVIAPELVLETPLVDLRALPPAERNGQARRLATDEARRPFDLAKGPLFRVKLLQLGETDHVALLTLHHINADGWSVQLFLRELVALYDAFSQGRPSPLPDPPLQYADYAAWQRRLVEEGGARQALDYWRAQLARIVPLDLPTDRPRPLVQSTRGAIRPFRFPPELGEAIRSLSRRERCTPFMTLLAAFQVLLQRWSGQDDIPVGSPYANRSRPEVEGVVGYFVNMLVLRNDLGGDPTFVELVQRTRRVVLDAIRHQDLPFSRVVEELQVTRDLSRHPLFQVMFAYQNAPRAEVNLASLKLRLARHPTDGGTGASKFELTLSMSDSRKGLKGRFQYNTDLFQAATIDRMIEHFQVLLEAVAADPARRLSELPLLRDDQRERLLAWSASPRPVPRPRDEPCVHRRFEAQASRTPDAVAVSQLGQEWTYDELNRKSNQLAHHLRRLGVAGESTVGLLIERCPEMVVAVLGILKAGGAYVPIDPGQPRQRQDAILDDARVPLLVTREPLLRTLPANRPPVVLLDSDGPAIATAEETNPPGGASAANLAAVLYTSGTTARPKGVMIEHQALAHYTEAASAEYAVAAGDRVLQFASLAFDASMEEIFPCLTRGGRLVLRTDAMLDSYAGFLAACSAWGISVVSLPTAYWHELAAAVGPERLTIPPGLRLVIIGGEAALPARVAGWRRWAGRTPRLLNTYGPTEATVVATSCDLTEPGDDGSAPIGRPLGHVRTYVLDASGRPAPIGVPGELFLGGPVLARGYANRPAATAERFAPDPFSAEPGGRLYRTGDRARWRSDGQLEYLGRTDDQVKIRGHRVEPGEVEAALHGHPEVREAAVVAREDMRGHRRLVAYVVADGAVPPAASDLRGYLRQRLPDALVPSAFVAVPSLPRSPGGKVDRPALPPPPPADGSEDDRPYREPRTETERTLAAIWSELLGRDRIGIDDSFFDLGGHSLLAIRLAARVRERLDVGLPLPRIFLAPTIADLAPVVEELARSGSSGREVPDRPPLDLEAEASLDPTIRPGPRPAGFVASPERVLLTGATGFLGTFLLADLLRQTRAEVSCLVRCESVEDGARRLRSALAALGLWDEAWASRIVPVPGDLGQPRLGLSEAGFARLAGRVEAIVHNGALINTLYPYEQLRAVNVLGTQEVLRLATLGTTKTVHHISTLSVLKSMMASGPDVTTIRETDPLGPGLALRGGYVQSKWVAERMMAAARARGVPVCIYRPGRISGDSRTGACNTKDLMFLMLKGVRRTGSVPALQGRVNLVPVDFVSRAIVHLATRPGSRDRTFHLLNPNPLPMPELLESVQALGVAVRPVPLDDWRQALRGLAETGAGASDASAVLALRPPRSRPAPRSARPAIDWQNTREGLEGSGLACPPVDSRLIETYYSYLVRNGLLDGD